MWHSVPKVAAHLRAGQVQTFRAALPIPTTAPAVCRAKMWPILCQVRHRSNRSRRGLYDGKDIRTGNNVSFSMKATKRTFKPNVFRKRLYSELLDDMLPFHVTAAALRSIDKAGGLDHYLLSSKHIVKDVDSEGWQAQQKILQRLKNQARIGAANGNGRDTPSPSADSSQ